MPRATYRNNGWRTILQNAQQRLDRWNPGIISKARTVGAYARQVLLSHPAPGTPWRAGRIIALWISRALGLAVAGLVALQLNLFWLFGGSPSLSSIANPDLAVASEVWSADSVLLGRYWVEDRVPVTREQVPQVLVDALVATEDVRFFQHSGVDLVAPFAIVWSAIRGDARGGSTLTQQLAKNLYNLSLIHISEPTRPY